MSSPNFPSNAFTTLTSITLGNVTVWDAGIKGHMVRAGRSEIRRTLFCKWTDLATLYNAVMPQGFVNAVVGADGYGYPQPFGCPLAPGTYIMDFDFEGIENFGLATLNYLDPYGNPIVLVAYATAKVELTYRNPEFPSQSTDGTDIELDFSHERIRVPGSAPAFSFTSNDTTGTGYIDPDDAPPLEYTIIGIDIIRRYQPSLPLSTIVAAAAAPVNSTTFNVSSAGQTESFAAGLIKYQGTKSSFSTTGNNANQWKITHRFKYRQYGWNTALDCNPQDTNYGTWQTLYYVKSTNSLYATSDLNVLLQ